MKKETYKPNPVKTTDIELPKHLVELTEFIAKNTHDVWAEERISQGWTYGEDRDDVKKTTPCLVPYEELSSDEKIFDINTSIETIKLIIKLGYTINKKNREE